PTPHSPPPTPALCSYATAFRSAERRLEAQAERLSQLEQQKTPIAEFVPQLVKNQAANLNIPEASIPDVSNVLVAHAQMRAELSRDRKSTRLQSRENRVCRLRLE